MNSGVPQITYLPKKQLLENLRLLRFTALPGLHTAGVTGSIPVPPTSTLKKPTVMVGFFNVLVGVVFLQETLMHSLAYDYLAVRKCDGYITVRAERMPTHTGTATICRFR